MNGSGHNRWSEDLAAYMLGALEPAEAAEFERHLESCERCRVEMRWFEPAVQTLPESIARQEPPRSLRRPRCGRMRGGPTAEPARSGAVRATACGKRSARRGCAWRPASPSSR